MFDYNPFRDFKEMMKKKLSEARYPLPPYVPDMRQEYEGMQTADKKAKATPSTKDSGYLETKVGFPKSTEEQHIEYVEGVLNNPNSTTEELKKVHSMIKDTSEIRGSDGGQIFVPMYPHLHKFKERLTSHPNWSKDV